MPRDLGDQRLLERGQTIEESRGPRSSPEQRMQPAGAIEISDLGDEPGAHHVDWGHLGPKLFREGDEAWRDLLEVTVSEADEQGILVREVLVERTDRDACCVGDVVGRDVAVVLGVEKASSLVEDAPHGLPGTSLAGAFAGFGRPGEMRVARHEQYSHIGGMRTVSVATTLQAPADIVWPAAQTPHAFVHVAAGMLHFPAAERIDRPWRTGDEVHGWILLFGVVPFSKHYLAVESIDDERRVIVSDERGGLIRTWRHEITVTPIDPERCHYEDRIQIDAGLLTGVIAAYAHIFYRHRQRRWRTLASLLAATSAATRQTPRT